MTRSPAANPLTPSPRLSTVPANSAPGENGNAGLYWYFPAMISRSKKFSAAASTRTTASPGPATGSGRSATVRSSGLLGPVQINAFMVQISRFYLASGQCRGTLDEVRPVSDQGRVRRLGLSLPD